MAAQTLLGIRLALGACDGIMHVTAYIHQVDSPHKSTRIACSLQHSCKCMHWPA